jgi:group I intron endonuclease
MIIYLTTNTINNKKYVGKDSHNNPKYLGSGVLLLEDIKKYGKSKFNKEILEYCNNDEELALRESYWIKYYGAIKSDLFYNLIDYNTGWNIDKLGKEKYNSIRDKISKSKIGIPQPWLSNDQNRKDKLRNSNKGKPKPEGFGKIISNIKISQNLKYTPEHCQKISNSKLGKQQPQSFLDKKYKPITQLDKQGNIINQFKNTIDAVNSNIKFKQANISCCLTGVSKTAYGFKWKYT